MTILVKPWMGREDGRILVVKHNKVVCSMHFRNQEHKTALIKEIQGVIK